MIQELETFFISESSFSSVNFVLPEGLVAKWASAGYNFHLQYPIHTNEGLENYIHWWLLNQDETPYLREDFIYYFVNKYYQTTIDLLLEERKFPPILELIFKHRSDLAFIKHDFQKLIYWWIDQGVFQYRLPQLELNNYKNIKHLIKIIYTERDDLKSTFLGTEKENSEALIHWWIQFGYLEYGFKFPFKIVHNEDIIQIVKILYIYRSDLRATFPEEERVNYKNLILWWIRYGYLEYGYEYPILKNQIWVLADKKIPDYIKLIIQEKDNVNKLLNDFETFVYWWLTDGAKQYGQLKLNLSDKQELNSLMMILWSNRDDLRSAFPEVKNGNYKQLIIWWIQFGYLEYEFEYPISRDKNWILSDKKLPKHIKLIFENREDISSLLDDFDALVYWWLTDGVKQYGQLELNLSDKQELNSLMRILWSNRADLRSAFPEVKNGNYEQLINWWIQQGYLEYGLMNAKMIKYSSLNLLKINKKNKKIKIALFGYHNGILGLGEDARLISKALQKNGYEVDEYAVDLPSSSNTFTYSRLLSIKDYKHEYSFNIFCMPAFDLLGLFTKYDLQILKFAWNIGVFQWELKIFPREAYLVTHLIDEIFSISDFASASIQSTLLSKVDTLPLPFDKINLATLKTNNYNLPVASFSVFFAFDGNSFIARKNPLAVIEAFQMAFPDMNDNVQLVIKVSNSQCSELWNECLRRIELDNRIFIFEKILTKHEMLNFMNRFDCILSLHRAEGFGRLIGEAMLMKKIVISSYYSGEKDFLSIENAYLISGQEIKTYQKDYLFSNQNYWYQPSIQDASEKLKLAKTNRKKNQKLQRNAFKTISENYSIEKTSLFFKEKIEEKFTQLLYTEYNEVKTKYLLQKDNLLSDSLKIAVQIHVYYPELLHEILNLLHNVPIKIVLLISTNSEDKKSQIVEILAQSDFLSYQIKVIENRGRDILPLILGFGQELLKYDIALHLHTKKSPHNSQLVGWRKYIYSILLGNQSEVSDLLNLMVNDKKIGILYPTIYKPVIPLMRIGGNEINMRKIINLLGEAYEDFEMINTKDFPAGSMCWFKPKCLKKFINSSLSIEDFEKEQGQDDSTMAHAIERMLPYIALKAGYTTAKICPDSWKEFEKEGTVPFKLVKTYFPYIDKEKIIIFFDHNLGGGTNYYSDVFIKNTLHHGSSVLRITFDGKWCSELIINEDGMIFHTANIESLFEALEDLNIKQIVINSLFTFPHIDELISKVLALKQSKRAYLKYKVHDFHSVCPSQHLLNSNVEYCWVPKNIEECNRCLIKNLAAYWASSQFRQIQNWRFYFNKLFENSDEIIVFDESAIEILSRAYDLKNSNIHVKPHTNPLQFIPIETQKEFIHIGVFGNFHEGKGSKIVNELAEYIVVNKLDIKITIVGTSVVKLHPSIDLTGFYQQKDLPVIIKHYGINTYFMSSIIPETFSYTLSEAMSMQLPIVSFDIGAQGRRLKEYEYGNLIKLSSSSQEIINALVEAFQKKNKEI